MFVVARAATNCGINGVAYIRGEHLIVDVHSQLDVAMLGLVAPTSEPVSDAMVRKRLGLAVDAPIPADDAARFAAANQITGQAQATSASAPRANRSRSTPTPPAGDSGGA